MVVSRGGVAMVMGLENVPDAAVAVVVVIFVPAGASEPVIKWSRSVGVAGWGDGDWVSEAEFRDPGESAAAKWAPESQLWLALAALEPMVGRLLFLLCSGEEAATAAANAEAAADVELGEVE